MNDLTLLDHLTSDRYFSHLQHHLNERQLLDENRNLSLSESTEQDFLGVPSHAHQANQTNFPQNEKNVILSVKYLSL